MCWRTYFLRRMESQAKGTHYNICACARKETTEGWKKTRRYGRVLYDTRVLTCSTSGSRHVWHPGLGMHDTRVSDTRKRLTGLMTQEENNTETCNAKERQKEKVNTMFKEYFYSLFLCSRPIIHFFEQYIPLVHTYNPLVTNIIYHQQHYTFNFLGFFLHNGAEL